MKTKKVTKERKQERELAVANCDIKNEFECVLCDDFIDELAMCEVDDDE